MSKPKDFVTTYQSIAGWNAVHVWWNPDLGGYWEPYAVERVRSATEAPAIEAAKQWAVELGLEYKPREQS